MVLVVVSEIYTHPPPLQSLHPFYPPPTLQTPTSSPAAARTPPPQHISTITNYRHRNAERNMWPGALYHHPHTDSVRVLQHGWGCCKNNLPHLATLLDHMEINRRGGGYSYQATAGRLMKAIRQSRRSSCCWGFFFFRKPSAEGAGWCSRTRATACRESSNMMNMESKALIKSDIFFPFAFKNCLF